MSRSRLPQAKAEASGAALKNPQRFVSRKAPKRVKPLGQPYAYMTEEERECWAELAQDLPWLNASHRTLMQIVCRVKSRFQSGDEIGVSALTLLQTVLSKLGATPVDETKVNHGNDGDDDPNEKFFGRPN
jgi:hypothetical protein